MRRTVSAPARRRLLLLAALGALAANPACRRPASGPPPERFLSARAQGVVLAPELGRAARELSSLGETLAAFPGLAPQLARARAALTAQLGFDPLDPAALAQAGLDPSRGAALGLEPGAGAGAVPVLVLPVGDAGRLEGLVERLARERLGAPDRTVQSSGALRAVTFRSAPGAPAAICYALSPASRTLVLAPGPSGPEAAVAALSRPAAESLAESPAFGELRRALGDRPALLTAALPDSPRLPPWGRDGAALGVSAEAGAIRLGLALRLGDRAAGLRALRAAGKAGPATRWLAPGSALVLRWDGDLAELGRRLASAADPHHREWLRAHGFDLQRDLFDLLAPGAALSVSPSPRLDLAGLSDVSLRADPLRVMSFEAVGEVKDEATSRASLARLPALFAALAEPAGGPALAQPAPDPTGATGRVITPSGELAWHLSGKRLLLAGGPPGALQALAAREGGAGAGWTPPTRASAAALEGGLGGAVLDPRSLAASLRALPDQAYGTGPGGFVVRSLVERFLEPAERIAAVSARAELKDAALFIELLAEVPPGTGKEAGR